MSGSKQRRGEDFSEIRARLEDAIENCEDEKQRYHARKAAQRVVLAQETS